MKKLIILSVFVLIGCFHDPINKEKLIGTYIYSESPSSDTLYIYGDKRYKYKYTTNEGKIYENYGHWEYKSYSNEILFEDFVFFNEEGNANPPGSWYSRIRSKQNEINLMYSKENNIFYKKIDINPNYNNDVEFNSIMSWLIIEYTNEKFYSVESYIRLASQISKDEFSRKIIHRVPFLAVVFLHKRTGEYSEKYKNID